MRRPVSRREFVRTFSAAGAVALTGAGGGLDGLLDPRARYRSGPDANGWNPLGRGAEIVSPHGVVLSATDGRHDLGGGVNGPALMLNESLPSPLLRMRRGHPFKVTLENHLRDDLILHWHGLTPPQEGDGHPRFSVGTGRRYEYEFTVEDRAATYWYHSHAHHHAARHTYFGIGGFLIVEDDEEDALGLPKGEREIPLMLQDRELDARGFPVYVNPNLMGGHTGSAPFGNGVHRPYLELDTALYRFRVLNGSNARIFRLERDDGKPLVMIGNDGGLLERPVTLPWIEIGPAERADLLVDLSDASVGDRITLRTAAFEMGGTSMDVLGGASLQGVPMELVQLRVVRQVQDDARIPETLVPLPSRPSEADVVRERRFEFMSDRDPNTRSIHMRHRINGKEFEMERVDERVPFGEAEIWTFANDGRFAHPVHLHGTRFQVLTRTGGRDQVFPWEAGLKDTVLLYPNETVTVLVRFEAHRGLYPLHCHNLEHEGVGMMLNILVE